MSAFPTSEFLLGLQLLGAWLPHFRPETDKRLNMFKRSDFFLLLGVMISFFVSGYLWFNGQRIEGIFTAIWVPAILGFGIYFKLMMIWGKLNERWYSFYNWGSRFFPYGCGSRAYCERVFQLENEEERLDSDRTQLDLSSAPSTVKKNETHMISEMARVWANSAAPSQPNPPAISAFEVISAVPTALIVVSLVLVLFSAR